MIFAFCSGAILLAGIVSAGIDALMLVHAALIGRILAGIGGGTPLPSSSEGHFLMAKGVGTPPPAPFPPSISASSGQFGVTPKQSVFV